MFQLSDAQYRELRAHDTDQFVRRVAEQMLVNRPDLVERPGRSATLRNMRQAFEFARHMGVQSTPHVIRWMYLAADAPGIQDDPAMSAYLLRKGGTPEQRLDDLFAVMNHKLKGMI